MALISSILILGLMVIFRKYILISSALLAFSEGDAEACFVYSGFLRGDRL